MNFNALQLLINSLVHNFKCDMCRSDVTSEDISINSIEGKKVKLSIACKKCNSVSVILSEVMTIDLQKSNLTNNQIMTLKNTVGKRQTKKVSTKIKDETIVELDRNLKKDKMNASDLFG